MNIIRIGKVLTIIACVTLVGVAISQNKTWTRYNYYQIRGKTFKQLKNGLDEYGPGPYHAIANWHVDWRFRYKEQLADCGLTDIHVNKTIVVTLPKWVNKPATSTPLTKEWHRYITALKLHEKTHIDFASKTQYEIYKALKALKPEKGCTSMGKKANDRANQILNKYTKLEREYDIQTDYGRKKGAKLRVVK